MQAKIDTLRVKDDNNSEYLLYPKTLTRCVTDEDGNTLANELSDIKARLSTNIDARFLTEEGYGGLRYYAGVFQSYDESTSTWVDIQPTDDNALILNLAPQPMQKMRLSFDVDAGFYKITFKEPKDTIVDGQMLVCVEGIKFVRKLGSEPTSVDDGTLVLDYKRRKFSNYIQTSFLDESFTANIGENWYYKAFPYSTNGHIGESSTNVASSVCKDYLLFGFKLDQSESDPVSMITYLEDCDNAYYESAYMDYTSGTFNYGDWADVWFIKDLKPVMLKYDGTVGYELDKNDYARKADGTVSDVANTSYEGNAMVGIPKVYWKIIDNGDDTANIYFSNKKVDEGYHCWSHIDSNGDEIDYCYMPVYNGSSDGTRLRSLSGLAPYTYATPQTMVDHALINNTNDDIIWYTELFIDRQLITLLLLLIGKSTDTQTVFGNGYHTGGLRDTYLNPGSMDAKGLFWGDNTQDKTGVKIFGMENWWGHILRYVAGCNTDSGVLKVKLTYGQDDGSTTDGYTVNADGYITVNWSHSGITGGYATKMIFTPYGLIPTTTGGSSTTYYTDGLWFDDTNIRSTVTGGASTHDNKVGAMTIAINCDNNSTNWHVNTSLSCKPLATT